MGISKVEEMTRCDPGMEPCIAERRVGVALTKVALGKLGCYLRFLAVGNGTTLCSFLQPTKCAHVHDSHPHDAKVSRCSLPSSKETAVTITATISWHALEAVAGLSMSRKNHQCDTELVG